ncbi:MAG: hypothetical protein Q4B70_08500 [Lachnospiraceae bacterium]|nr:hypothetical protein [Lachnospiraceae bacterium]
MKKKTWKVLATFILAMIVLVGFTGIETKAASTEWKATNKFKKTVTLTKDNKKEGIYYSFTDIENASYENVKVTSSKKSVATVKKDYLDMEFRVYPKKTGTTKITWTATDPKTNKQLKRTGTIKVVKYENPFSSLKIESKNYASKAKKDYSVANIKTNKTKLKLNYKLKKNWKLVSGGYMTWNPNNCKWKSQKIKNGKTYTLQKNAPTSFSFNVKNTKTGATMYMGIAVNE